MYEFPRVGSLQLSTPKERSPNVIIRKVARGPTTGELSAGNRTDFPAPRTDRTAFRLRIRFPF